MSDRRPSVVFLARWLGFPNGMAESSRVRLLGRALVEEGARVLVLSTGVSERPPVVENVVSRGMHRGVAFEYSTGQTIRSDSFTVRRVVEAVGWARAVTRLCLMKSRGDLDCVYLWWHGMSREPSRRMVLMGLRLLRVPVVIELNELPWQLEHQRVRGIRRRSHLSDVNGVVAISNRLAAWARREACRLGSDAKVLEIPVVVDVYEQEAGDYPAGDPVLLLAAASQYSETIHFVLEAMNTVWEAFPSTRLMITGVHPSAPSANWFRDMVAREELDDRVDVVGYVPRQRLLSLYAEAHALLIPLFDDPVSVARFPTKIGEYLAAGRPVVTSSVGEITRYMRDGSTAFIAPPGEAALYGAKICEVLADRPSAAKVGRSGRRLAEESFHYAVYGPVLRSFFSEVAAEAQLCRSARNAVVVE